MLSDLLQRNVKPGSVYMGTPAALIAGLLGERPDDRQGTAGGERKEAVLILQQCDAAPRDLSSQGMVGV